MADIFFGTHIGIDAMLFHDQLLLQAERPSRMAPNAALCGVMIGVAMICLSFRSQKLLLPAQLLALVTALISLFAIVGYVYSVEVLYQIQAFIPMALHTGLAFLSLSSYMLLITRHDALMIPLSDQGAGGYTARRLLPVAVALPITVGWLILTGERQDLYTQTIGITLVMMVNLLLFTIVIWWNARLLLVSENKRRVSEAELARAATHDFLTDLANRSLFMERLAGRFAAFRRRETELFAVMFMDLDGFKQVNDHLGHEAGDILLRQVGELLRHCVRAEDIAARIGGDEFTMLLDRIAGPDDVKLVAGRILAGMPKEIGPLGGNLRIGISIGGVIAATGHANAQALLNDADLALYKSKNDGKHRFSLHSGPLQLAES